MVAQEDFETQLERINQRVRERVLAERSGRVHRWATRTENPISACDDSCIACGDTAECARESEAGFRDGLVGFPSTGEHSVSYWRGFDAGVAYARAKREDEAHELAKKAV